MNLFEMMGCVGGLAGMLGGASAGFRVGHTLGGIAGGVGGAVVGFVGGYGLVSASFGLSITLERFDKRRELRRTFGRYWTSDEASKWRGLGESLRGGQTLEGTVVAHRYYGVFVDVGLGFPALLTRSELEGPIETATLPPLGAQVEAQLLELHGDQELILTLRSDHAWLESGGRTVAVRIGNTHRELPAELFFADFAPGSLNPLRDAEVAAELVSSDGRRPVWARGARRGPLQVRARD